MALGGLAELERSWKMRGDENWQIRSATPRRPNWSVAQHRGASHGTAAPDLGLTFLLGFWDDSRHAYFIFC